MSLPAFPTLFKPRCEPPAADPAPRLEFPQGYYVRYGDAIDDASAAGWRLLRLVTRADRPLPLHCAARAAFLDVRGMTVPQLREKFRGLMSHCNVVLLRVGCPLRLRVAGDFVTLG